MALISLRDVGFTYAYAANPALRGVTLDVERGRMLGVVGPNGSGKSTLCHVIRGTVPRFYPGQLTGELVFDGRNAVDWDPDAWSRAIGYVFQNPFTQISGIKDSVFEEIAFGLENLGVERAAIVRRVGAVLREMEIDALAGRNPNGLSGGQRQLVAFAAVIAMDADILVIDEPTSQLDPETTAAVFRIMGGLRDRGKTIILVEHDIDLLAEYADDILLLAHGEVLGCGQADVLLASDRFPAADTRRPQVAELGWALQAAGKPLGAIPVTRAQAERLIRARMDGG